MIYLSLLSLLLIVVPDVRAQWTCMNGLEDCNSWCQNQYGNTLDAPARLVCYTGCGVAFLLCETGIINFEGGHQQ